MLTEGQINELTKSDDTQEKVMEAKREDEEARRSEIESSFQAGVAEAEADVDLEETRPMREELERRFPGRSASHVVRDFLSYDEQLRANPADAATRLAEQYARTARFADPQAPKPIEGLYGEVGTKLPNGKVLYNNPDDPGHDIAQAMAQTMKDTGEVEPLREIQKLLRERYPDRKFSDALQQVVDFDREAARDPYRAFARLAATYGMPLDDQQAAAQSAAQAKSVEMTQLIGSEFKQLKGREGELVNLINRGVLQLSHDTRQDLRTAQQILKQNDQAQGEIKAFAAKHADFEKLKPKMAKLLRDGKAESLDEAYKLVKSHPKDLTGRLADRLDR